MSIHPYTGLILDGTNMFLWKKGAVKYLKANLLFRAYQTDFVPGPSPASHELDLQDAAIARLALMVSPSISDRLILKAKSAKDAWNLLLATFEKRDQLKAACIATTLGTIRYQGEDVLSFLDRLEDLVDEHAFYSGEESNDAVLCSWLLATLKDSPTYNGWAWERQRNTSSMYWFALRNEFVALQGTKTAPNVFHASAAVHTGPSVTGSVGAPSLVIKLSVPATSITQKDLLDALKSVGVPYCHHHNSVGHATDSCTRNRPGNQNSAMKKTPSMSGTKALSATPVQQTAEARGYVSSEKDLSDFLGFDSKLNL